MISNTAIVDGITLRWEESGEGMPVILPKLGIPAGIVWGVADQFQKIEYGERFARDLSAPLQRIDGGKHFTPEDHPETIAEGINKLVADVAATETAASAGNDKDLASGL